MKLHRLTIGCMLLCTCLSGCFHQYSSNDPRYAVCKELNRQIVLNGATTNPRTADIQRADRGRLLQAYDANQCSGSW